MRNSNHIFRTQYPGIGGKIQQKLYDFQVHEVNLENDIAGISCTPTESVQCNFAPTTIAQDVKVAKYSQQPQ